MEAHAGVKGTPPLLSIDLALAYFQSSEKNICLAKRKEGSLTFNDIFKKN